MLLSIHPDNPNPRHIKQVVEVLVGGGIIIYPTDTVYGLGCDIFQPKAVERIARLRSLDPTKANLTFICQDISQLSGYCKQLDNQVFKMLKRNVPGPFTFLFRASQQLPKVLKNRRKTIGIRIPDHPIVQHIVAALGHPILSISLKSDDAIIEYLTDPYEINEQFGRQVDLVIDGGVGGNRPSTVVDCTGSEINIIREGLAELR